MQVERPEKRNEVRANFLAVNALACQAQRDDRARICPSLKLADMTGHRSNYGAELRPRPAHVPERLEYSTVAMVTTSWSRAPQALGSAGCRSRIPEKIGDLLGLPSSGKLVAYLCIGWPKKASRSLTRASRLARTHEYRYIWLRRKLMQTEIIGSRPRAALEASSRSAALLGALFAGFLGGFLIWGVGFSHIDVVHNATHDARHSSGFPCH
jgi:cobalt transporter subunit CbtB